MDAQDREKINLNLQQIASMRELLEWHASYCGKAEEFQREREISHLIRDEILRRFSELQGNPEEFTEKVEEIKDRLDGMRRVSIVRPII